VIELKEQNKKLKEFLVIINNNEGQNQVFIKNQNNNED
jgi:hypothetical protein